MIGTFKKYGRSSWVFVVISACCLLAVVSPVQGEGTCIAWLKQKGVIFRTENFGQGFEDLGPLKKVIGDARIVALGEGTHGTAEFFKMKHRITEYLATELGFTIFVIEANMPEAQKVNDYILTGKGDLKEALAGLHFWTWHTQEVLDMLMWMRAFNASGKGQIVFWGMDMQFPHAALHTVQTFFEKEKPFHEAWVDTCDVIRDAFFKAQKSQEASQKWVMQSRALLTHLETMQGVATHLEPAYLDWVVQCARLVWQSAVVHEEFARARVTPGLDSSSRDVFMAQNVAWILSQHAPDAKMVLWAHNGHVSRTGFPLLERPLGYHLERKFRQDFINIGFAFYEGTYTAKTRAGALGTFTLSPAKAGSVGWWLHRADMDRFFLDLSNASRENKQWAWLYEALDFRQIGALAMDRSYPVVLPEAFDMLIFFNQTHASTLLDTPILNPWKKQVSASQN